MIPLRNAGEPIDVSSRPGTLWQLAADRPFWTVFLLALLVRALNLALLEGHGAFFAEGGTIDYWRLGVNRGDYRSVAHMNTRTRAVHLRRAHTFLPTLGIEIVFGREGRLGTRMIRITAIGETQARNTVSTVSRVSNNGHGATGNILRPR